MIFGVEYSRQALYRPRFSHEIRLKELKKFLPAQREFFRHYASKKIGPKLESQCRGDSILLKDNKTNLAALVALSSSMGLFGRKMKS